MSYIEASKTLYDSRLRQHYGRPRGCWPWAIGRLERHIGFPLPDAYGQFLRWMGEPRNGPFRGSDCFPDTLLSIHNESPDLFTTHGISLIPRPFIFFLHQGYIAAWFTLPALVDDPPVWMFNEGSMSQPEQRWTFSQWLFESLQNSVQIAERLHEPTGNV